MASRLRNLTRHLSFKKVAVLSRDALGLERVRDENRARRLSEHTVGVRAEERFNAEVLAARAYADEINLFFFGVSENLLIRPAPTNRVPDFAPQLSFPHYSFLKAARSLMINALYTRRPPGDFRPVLRRLRY